MGSPIAEMPLLHTTLRDYLPNSGAFIATLAISGSGSRFARDYPSPAKALIPEVLCIEQIHSGAWPHGFGLDSDYGDFQRSV